MQRAKPAPGALSAALERELTGAKVESLRGGPLWLSLRIDGRQLHLVIGSDARSVWLDAEPLPAAWLTLLDRHERSPFAAGLSDARLLGVRVLRSEEGHDSSSRSSCACAGFPGPVRFG
jgi:hypothetical protein